MSEKDSVFLCVCQRQTLYIKPVGEDAKNLYCIKCYYQAIITHDDIFYNLASFYDNLLVLI